MIPSRTVFNHCKWIYIELAITGAHSGMGPLCISPAPDTSRQSPGECFPHFIPPCHQLQQPLGSRNRLPFSQLYTLPLPLFIFSISFSLSPPLLPSLRHRILLPLIVASLILSIHSSFMPHSFSFLLAAFKSYGYVLLSPSLILLLLKSSFFLVFTKIPWISHLLLSFSRSFLVPGSSSLIPPPLSLTLSFRCSIFPPLPPFWLLIPTPGLSRPFENKPLIVSVLVSVLHSRKTQGDVLFHLTAAYPTEGWKEIHVDFSTAPLVLPRPRDCPVRLLASAFERSLQMSRSKFKYQLIE